MDVTGATSKQRLNRGSQQEGQPQPDGGAPRKGKYSFQRNAILYLQTVSMSSLAQGAFGVIQGLYILSLGFNEEVLGTVLSFRMLSAAVASIPAGILSDRVGRKPVLVAAGLLTTAGYLGMSVVSAPAMMVLYSCLVGVAQACQMTSGAPLLAESSTAEDRAKLFGVNFSLSMGVNMVGSLLGGFLPRQLRGFGMVPAYRISLAVFSLITLAGVTPAMRIMENRSGARSMASGSSSSQGPGSSAVSEPGSPSVQEPGGLSAWGIAAKELVLLYRTASQKAVLSLLTYNLLIGFGAGLVLPYVNVFISRKLGVDTAVVGVIQSFSQGATAVAALLSPILADRFGRVATVVGTQIASIPFLLLIALPPNIYLVSFALFMRTALMNMSNPVASTFSMEIVGAENRGKVSSLSRIADNLTRALSAVVAGYIMANWSYEIPYFFTACTYLMASLVYYRAFRGWAKAKE
ncbi:MAG: MFS transporter [Bacillota bacterium]